MPGYIQPEYEAIEKELTPFIDEHELDKITVSSLIRGSVEVIDPEIPIASITKLNPNEMSGTSLKPQNIRVNLKFALNSIFSFKPVCEEKSLWLILAILQAIVFFIESMKVPLKRDEAIVLYALYRLRIAGICEISDYIARLKENGEIADIENINIEGALGNLEKLKAIKMLEGKYCLCETIMITKG